MRNYWLGSAALAAALASGGALAQVAEVQEEPTEVEEVVVTGYRAQNARAITAKRDAEQIAEFLTTDELGQLPDYNVSDSFRRVPGVQTVFDEDEGRYVAIRGLNPNFTFGSLDGSTLATAERQNRQLNMEAIPTTAVKRLEVYKSRTPDLEGNAIGGSVNLVTRSAFDQDGLYAVGQAFVGVGDSQALPGEGYNRDSDDGLNFRFDGTVSATFGDRDQFGVLVTGTFSRKRRDQERQLPQAYNATAGTYGVPVSRGFRTSGYPNTVDRYGGTLKLEWRPVEAFRAGFSATYYVQEDNELRYNHELTLPPLPAAPGPVYTPAPDDGLNVASATGYALFNDFPLEKPLTVIQADAAWDLADRQHLSGRVAYSEAEFSEPSNQVRFDVASSPSNAGVYRIFDGVPSFTFADPGNATYTDPRRYRFSSYNPYTDDSDDYIAEAQLDYAVNTSPGDRGWGFGAGVKTRENRRDFDTGQTFYGPSAANTLTLDAVDLEVDYRFAYAPARQQFIDFEALLACFRANPDQFQLNAGSTAFSNRARDYVVEERVNAAYGLARWANEDWTVIFGGRFEATETAIAGFRVVGSGAAARITPLARDGEYDHFLPSVNVIRDFGRGLKLRAASYSAIGRPNPSELGANENVNQGAGTVSRGNPDLQPREADNLDLALEHYWPGGQGLASAGVFWKDITNDIFSAAAGSTTIDGIEYDVFQPQNLSSSEIFGVEVNLIRNRLDFLPGLLSNFGVSANLTYIDAQSQLPDGRTFDRLQGQAQELGNFALFYEQGPFRTRVTYAYYGDIYTAINANDPNQNRYDKPFNQVDLQARWDFARFELIGEVRNLTDENRVNYQTGGLARDLNFFGRQFWVGVAFKPW